MPNGHNGNNNNNGNHGGGGGGNNAGNGGNHNGGTNAGNASPGGLGNHSMAAPPPAVGLGNAAVAPSPVGNAVVAPANNGVVQGTTISIPHNNGNGGTGVPPGYSPNHNGNGGTNAGDGGPGSLGNHSSTDPVPHWPGSNGTGNGEDSVPHPQAVGADPNPGAINPSAPLGTDQNPGPHPHPQASGGGANAGVSGPSHIVVHGETLSGIAAQHGIGLAQLEALNPQIKNPNMIFPGQTVKISNPETGGVAAAQDPAQGQILSYYKVQPQDTLNGSNDVLNKVATQTGVPLSQLQSLNPALASNPDLITPGKTVVTAMGGAPASASDDFPSSSSYPPAENVQKAMSGKFRNIGNKLKGWGVGNMPGDPAKNSMYITGERNTDPLNIKDHKGHDNNNPS